MKNLLVLHLESVCRQRFAAFASSFPNSRRLMQQARVFDRFFSSATSTLMVVTCFFHGNDFEFDACAKFEGMRPAGNNGHLFSLLQERGWNANLVCLNGFHLTHPTKLSSWAGDLPPVWGTNDYPTLFARFDDLTDAPPFAIYVWDLITHVEHSLALAPHADGYTDQVRRACQVADDAIGVLLATLSRKGLLDETTIVLYGDHGDDYWTHGFKGGMTHATEPYTQITWTPLAIRDPTLAAGVDERLASTIDLAPTCLELLGVDHALSFSPSAGELARSRALRVPSRPGQSLQPAAVLRSCRRWTPRAAAVGACGAALPRGPARQPARGRAPRGTLHHVAGEARRAHRGEACVRRRPRCRRLGHARSALPRRHRAGRRTGHPGPARAPSRRTICVLLPPALTVQQRTRHRRRSCAT